MPYSLKDVDAAEALVLAIRPETLVERGDFDWSLSVRDKDSTYAVILFQPRFEGQPEIKSTEEHIRNVCFMLGSQWTPEQIGQMTASHKDRPH